MKIFGIVVLLALGGCVSMSEAMEGVLKSRGEVVKEYPSGHAKIIVMKEGDSYIKYRINNFSSGMVNGATYDPVYIVDTSVKECFGGVGARTIIPCAALASDPDLGSFASSQKR